MAATFHESPTSSSAPPFEVNTKAVLPSPHQLKLELPATQDIHYFVDQQRTAITEIIEGRSTELLVLVGPCSIHDTHAAIDYASRLKKLIEQHKNVLRIVMRVYCEKPRSGAGWKGLIRDPFLDGSNDIGAGLHKTRQLLLQINSLGIPCGVEFLDPIVVEYISDLVSWGTIGARTAESQIHRELASGLAMPVGFKNATNGHVQGALDGILVAARPQSYISVNSDGHVAVNCTKGNPSCHLVLRGGHSGPNYHADAIASILTSMKAKFAGEKAASGTRTKSTGTSHAAAGRFCSVVVDCSHDNSGKDHRQQPAVVTCLAEQMISSPHRHHITGIMLESFLEEGSQALNPRPGGMEYGKSVTDPCMNLTVTAEVLDSVSNAVQLRRKRSRAAAGDEGDHGIVTTGGTLCCGQSSGAAAAGTAKR